MVVSVHCKIRMPANSGMILKEFHYNIRYIINCI